MNNGIAPSIKAITKAKKEKKDAPEESIKQLIAGGEGLKQLYSAELVELKIELVEFEKDKMRTKILKTLDELKNHITEGTKAFTDLSEIKTLRSGDKGKGDAIKISFMKMLNEIKNIKVKN